MNLISPAKQQPTTTLMAVSQSLLSIRNASKSYGGIPALMNAALDLKHGEVHALMGENGAGKSTLIKLLAGVTAPDSLDITLNGTPIHIHSPQAAFAHGLRFIHQELNVVPQLSVAENIFISQRYPRRIGVLVDWGRLNQRAREVLAQLGISHIMPTDLVARLSTGDRMLVKIAGAVVADERQNAVVYVMDEPTAALTRAETERLFEVIAELKAKGAGILYVSHRMDEVFTLADRITVMRDGCVIATLPTDETTPHALIQLMTGRTFDHAYPERSAAPDEKVLLDVQNLTTQAITDVNFQLHAGEILGVAGLQGAGRTELLRALAGADRIVSGQIILDGKPLKPRAPVGAWRSGFAFTPEERRTQGLILSRSVRDNTTLPHLGDLSRKGLFLLPSLEGRSTTTLGTAVRLKASSPRQKTRQLSGGNQQKVLFARALAGSPRVLLLDEPTRGVDVGAKYDLYTLICEAAASGKGVLLASSELGELLGLCDRILIMRAGRLAEIVEARDLTQAALLTLCYGALDRDN